MIHERQQRQAGDRASAYQASWRTDRDAPSAHSSPPLNIEHADVSEAEDVGSESVAAAQRDATSTMVNARNEDSERPQVLGAQRQNVAVPARPGCGLCDHRGVRTLPITPAAANNSAREIQMTQTHKPSDLWLSDIATLRQRARRHVGSGAVTPSYAADRATVLRLLNEALATELVCVLRYRRHSFTGDGLLESILAKEEEHAEELSSMLRQTATVLPGAASSMMAGGAARRVAG